MSRMDAKTQREFMYLFERVGEPLYFGPKGKDNVSYNVPMDGKDPKMMDAAIQSRRLGPTVTQSFDVQPPREMPNLSPIGRLCPKNTLFSYFSDQHLDAAARLKDILMQQETQKEFLSMGSVCRDSEMINPQLWIFAFASTALERPDMKGFRMPAFVEICPDMFITPAVSRIAQQQAQLPAQDRKKIKIELPPTGNALNPENSLAYFREDIGLNSHHYHWHLVFTRNHPRGKRDRKGELFYYMHSQMLRRYYAERLGNNLGLAQPISLEDKTIVEGYFPKLHDTNAGIAWGGRQSGTKFVDVDRTLNTENLLVVRIQQLQTWRDRILEAIDVGEVIGTNGERLKLDVELLGDILENSSLSPNVGVYGSLHNSGHDLFAYAHDPIQLHEEKMGVMGATAVAMRDPIFYRWHVFIDNIVDKFQERLGPYRLEELLWNGVQVSNISAASTAPGAKPNILHTNWLLSDVDLARGLDFRRTRGGAVWATFQHLNHIPFVYNFSVINTGLNPVTATIRVFMAPKYNERGRRFDLKTQRKLFFEMDKFAHTLTPGKNDIARQSKDSAVTIPFEQSFQQLEKLTSNDQRERNVSESVCGCGWPSHLLLPKSTPAGITYDLYVIVTNGAEDQIRRKMARTELQERICKESISFCGIRDDFYPDKKAMGYPWDRPIREEANGHSPSLNDFVKQVPNSGSVEVRIIHRDEKLVNPGGGPKGMEFVSDGSKLPPSSPNLGRGGTPPPVRPLSPSWPSSPASPGGRRGFSFGTYKPDGFTEGNRFSFNFPSRWRSGRETNPEDEEGWTHL